MILQLRPDGRRPGSSKLPMRIDRTTGPENPLATGFWNGALGTDVIDQCDGEITPFPLNAAVRKKAPISKVGVRLIRPIIKILRESNGWRGCPAKLRAITRQVVGL